MSVQHVKVAIIGAGMAGLSAAEHLERNHFHDWKILEATNRCGGRIRTTKFGSSFVEEGANWIHGACPSNSAFLFASERGLITSPLALFTRKDGLYFKSDGSVLSTGLTKKTYQLFKEVERKTTKLAWSSELSLRDFMKSKFHEFQESLDAEDQKDVARLLNHFLNYVAMHGGDDSHLMSAKGYGTYDEIPGGDVRVVQGYQTFVNALLSNLPSERVLLNRSVENITWNCCPSLVSCSNGETISADVVLVTVPLGVLKQNSLFNPQLPSDRVEVIGRTGFGRVCKIFLEYNHPFWQPGLLGIVNLTWGDEDMTAYANGDLWVTKLIAFEEIPTNRNVVMSWVGGEFAAHVETLPEEHVKLVLTDVLRKFLGNPTVPVPDRILVTRWCFDQWTGGCYSYYSMENEEGDFEKLSAPVLQDGRKKILFAGEVTHQRFFSTVHGARSSGVREAERILKEYVD